MQNLAGRPTDHDPVGTKRGRRGKLAARHRFVQLAILGGSTVSDVVAFKMDRSPGTANGGMNEMKKLITALLLTILASAPAWAQSECRLFFQNGSGLQVEPQDTQMALFEPDCYAWRLFVSLSWPSQKGQCGPDPPKALGADGETVWEKWIPKQDVFLPDAQEPPSWESHCRAVVTALSS